jgi:tetratricopeptide (TPR) repeat protein
MKRTLFTGIAILSLLVFSIPVQPVRADVAPPEFPPGSNVVPGTEGTQVRMLAETVTLSISADPAHSEEAIADTLATFTMRNLGTSAESMQARFPLSFFDGQSDGTGEFPEIARIAVKVNGKPVTTKRVMQARLQTEDNYSQREEIPWATFNVTFPPAEDVTIEVRYKVNGFGYYPYESFKYILETGAGWKDSIGGADIIVRLPYEATNYNVWLPDEKTLPETSPGAMLEGNEVRWHFEDLEPTRESNIGIEVVTPSLWLKVLKETATVTKNPGDGEAWGRLAKAYKEVSRMPKGYIREDAPGHEMYQLSKQAYEKCLALLPQDSLWHYGYADLLWSYYYYEIYWMDLPDPDGLYSRILSETKIALELDPNNASAKELLAWVEGSIPGSVKIAGPNYDWLGLTATPIRPTPWVYMSETPVVTATVPGPAAPVSPAEPSPAAVASPTLVKIDEPQSGPATPCGGAALILPVLFGLVFLIRKIGH